MANGRDFTGFSNLGPFTAPEPVEEPRPFLPGLDQPASIPGVPNEFFFSPFSVPNSPFRGLLFNSIGDLGALRPEFARFRELFPGIRSDIAGLRADFKPGFSKLREARLNAVTRARQRGLGDLRDSLARRRVLGSSFGGDALIRGEREFAELEAEEQAKSFLEELDANTRLIELDLGVVNSAINSLSQEAALVISQGDLASKGFALDLEEVGLELGEEQSRRNFFLGLQELASNNALALKQIEAQLSINRSNRFLDLLGTGLGIATGFGFGREPVSTVDPFEATPTSFVPGEARTNFGPFNPFSTPSNVRLV